MPTDFLRPRLAVLPALRAQGGKRAKFIPDADLLAFETPDAVDLTGTGTLVVRANSVAAAELLADRVVEVEYWSAVGVVSRTEEWRILSRQLVDGVEAGTDGGVVTCTLAHPISDWPSAGRIVAYPSGRPTWTHSGVYTPAEVLTLICDHLAARGQGHWVPGTCDRTDARELTIVDLDPAQARELAQTTWALEPVPERTNASTWTIHLRTKRAASAKVPTLRVTGALHRIDWTQDGTSLATAVLPIGAGGATCDLAGWTVASVTAGSGTTGTIGLVDGRGGSGPVQVDGQYVGAYLRKANGTLTQITATLRNDGLTSLVTVADRTNISAGSSTVCADVVEVRADAGGTRLPLVSDPAAWSAPTATERSRSCATT
jgi:hypothetical protein